MPKTSYILNKLSNGSPDELEALVKESDEQVHRCFLKRNTGSETGYYYWPSSPNNFSFLQQCNISQAGDIIDFDLSKEYLIYFGQRATIESNQRLEELEDKLSPDIRPKM